MTDSNTAEEGIAEQGAFAVIRKRLLAQGQRLEERIKTVNAERLEIFGTTSMEVIGRVRVRTENNCVPRDIINVGDKLLFGYNVYIGLKTTTNVGDVFCLQGLTSSENGLELEVVTESFLSEQKFAHDFNELYAYYKHAKLIHLGQRDGKLTAAFQIGQRLEDMRVFRWGLTADQQPQYIDNRGERDVQPPRSHDFDWTETQREQHVLGDHPHINILDQVFVETVGGDLTIKIEDNTDDGVGIYREAVDDAHQSLADAAIYYANLGGIILLKIKPYREETWRYLVFNTRNQDVARIDEIGQACVQLPEDHGIIFPGGYYLRSGERKRFDDDATGMEFQRQIRSPNGEDVLYVFYEPNEGRYALFSYNLIQKELQNPLYGHGYSLFDDGRMIIFRAENEEPTRVHPMQIWQTPFVSDEYASQAPRDQSLFGRIGNAELVRGISELYGIIRMISVQTPAVAVYEDLIGACGRVVDSYYWLGEQELGELLPILKEISETAELVLDEFEKVQAIQEQAQKGLAQAQTAQIKLFAALQPGSWNVAPQFVDGLAQLREQRGRLIGLRDMRYMDLGELDRLEQDVIKKSEELSNATVGFLRDDDALAPYHQLIAETDSNIEAAQVISVLVPLLETLDKSGQELELLTEVIGGLKIDDTIVRTKILEQISAVFSKLNRVKAVATLRRKELRSGEAVAEFGAEFQLFSQNVTSSLGLVDSPDKCDEQLSRLLVQLEDLEARFSDFDEFLADLMTKRDEVYEAFESRKQALLDERQRRAQNLGNSADRILETMQRRVSRFKDVDAINTYFAADAMVLKVREIVQSLRDLSDSVRADDVESRLVSGRDQAVRAIRDKLDIFEGDGAVIRLGKHRFSVNTQELDLTLLPRDDVLALHVTGTDFFSPLDEPRLNEKKEFWQQSLLSENADVYRGEYLAACLLRDAVASTENLSLAQLYTAMLTDDGLFKIVQDYATPRYSEGYDKGVHDADATLILAQLLKVRDIAGFLRFSGHARALAVLFWAHLDDKNQADSWQKRAQSYANLQTSFAQTGSIDQLNEELRQAMHAFFQQHQMAASALLLTTASQYLVEELKRETLAFTVSRQAKALADDLLAHLQGHDYRLRYEAAMQSMGDSIDGQWSLTEAWLQGYVRAKQLDSGRLLPEAIAVLIAGKRVAWEENGTATTVTITGLLGQHGRIRERSLELSLDEFSIRLDQFCDINVPAFKAFGKLRQQILQEERENLRLDEFKPKPLTSFVRNKLINEVYLPLTGDNLAKQMGSLGEGKRTDLMGMLLLISPPGYGKTTLMEYVASRLGLIFMKINCPTVGHSVVSLDPADTDNGAAKQEIEKLNLALEMGNNVMLYLDDIQHSNPEFLQKFISLCDGQRRIEGIWRGRAKTYDMRGKKFCVVMAGNPYTESGEAFKIPDMLANRADIYNLGDILGGNDDVFALSYIENSLTSNAVLSPLAMRDMEDVYRFVRLAGGEEINTTEFSHGYSGAEMNEIVSVLKKLQAIQQVVLAVNKQYIASAAQADNYRTEPPFKLQGSYRNMNKMTEKVVAVMNDVELQSLIADHYVGEAQTLTVGAEENLLKLAEIRGVMDADQSARWQQITADYQRIKGIGGSDADPVTKAANQMSLLVEHLRHIGDAIDAARDQQTTTSQMNQLGERLQHIGTAIGSASDKEANARNSGVKVLVNELRQLQRAVTDARLDIEVINQPVPGIDVLLTQMAKTIEQSLLPVVSAMEHKIRLDHDIWEKVKDVADGLNALDKKILVQQRSTKSSHRPLRGQQKKEIKST